MRTPISRRSNKDNVEVLDEVKVPVPVHRRGPWLLAWLYWMAVQAVNSKTTYLPFRFCEISV